MSAAVIVSVVFALAILTAVGLVSRRVWVDLREERRLGLNREASAGVSDTQARARPKFLPPLLYGFGGGISFLVGYLLAPVPQQEKIFIATGVFMVTAVALMFASRISQRKLWPLPWTTLLVVVMGGLTLWLHDETFIKIRPTLQYAAYAALAALALTGHRFKAALRIKELDFGPAGQWKMIFLLIGFGIVMALLNELVRRNSSDLFWIGFQIWGPLLVFGLFLAGSISTVKRHWTGQCKVRTTE